MRTPGGGSLRRTKERLAANERFYNAEQALSTSPKDTEELQAREGETL
jgi:hypothetical protein